MNATKLNTLSAGDTFATAAGTVETVERVRAEWLTTNKSAWSTVGADGERVVFLL
jgi:hypothetical protein